MIFYPLKFDIYWYALKKGHYSSITETNKLVRFILRTLRNP